jgi:hypothetical protein
MKLPQVNYNRPVQSLKQFDVNQPVAKARAKQGIINSAGDLANNMLHNAAKHTANTARSETLRKMSNWSKDNDGKAFYEAEELQKSGISEDIIGGRDVIPAYEVKPALMESAYQGIIDEQSEKVYQGKYRDQYNQSANDDMFIKRAQYTVAANKEQRVQQNAQVSADIEDLLIERQYDLADERINELQIEDSAKQAIRTKVSSEREYASYVDMVSFRDEAGAREALKSLHAEPSENMDEIKQLKAINLLENFLTEDVTAKNLQKADIKWRLNRMEKNATAGGNVDPDEYNKLMAEATFYGIEPRFMTEVTTAVRGNSQSNMIANLPADQQLAGMQSESRGSVSTEEGIQAGVLNTIAKRNVAFMNKDMIGYYDSINGNIPTIDFAGVAHIQGATGQLLADRKLKHDVAKDRLKVSQGYLKPEEVNVLTDMMLTASPNEIIAFTQEANGALGRDATLLYDQLRVTRPELGSLTVVGQLSAVGQNGAAFEVLKGHEYRKENREIIQMAMEDHLPKIHDELKGAFRHNPRYQSSIKNAILDVYAIKAASAGKPLESMDEDLMDAAIQTVTGGLLEHGDNTIEPPYYGGTQATLDTWLDNLNPDYIDDLGGAHHYSNKQIINSLRDEDFMLESQGNGEYLIVTERGKYLANKQGTGKFVLKYNELAPVVNQSDDVMVNPAQREKYGMKPMPNFVGDFMKGKENAE